MDLSSLPTYPPPPRPKPAASQVAPASRLIHRHVRILVDLASLAAIVMLLLWLGSVAEAIRHPRPPTGPLDFKLVQKNFARMHPGMQDEEVFALLGPQCAATFSEPEFERIEGLVDVHPDRYPGERYWAKWADPQDEGKWVAVFVACGKVYRVLKKGF